MTSISQITLTNLAPFPIRDANIYSPARSFDETKLRSNVIRHAFRKQRRLLTTLFQGGRVQNKQFFWQDIIVAMDDVYVEHIGVWLSSGAWVHTNRYVRGNDIFELIAYMWGTSYSRAFEMVAHHLDINSSPSQSSPNCSQESYPLYPMLNIQPSLYEPSQFVYRNELGIPNTIVRMITSTDGTSFPVYTIILKDKRSGRYQLAEAIPDKPYQLFNLNCIKENANANVAIFDSEEKAEARNVRGEVATTVPGGLKNILDADFSCLNGRTVYLHLRRQDVCHGLLIRQKLYDSNIDKIFFVIDDQSHSYPINELDVVARKLGIELINPKASVASPSALKASNLNDFLGSDIPTRGWILDPIIPEKGLAMIYAPRGVGKTHVGLGIAVACASGSDFLRWRAPKACRVLYIDGEMAAFDLKKRLEEISLHAPKTAMQNLQIITPDDQDGPMPNLSTKEGQRKIKPYLDNVSLVILDNLATLCREGNENSGDSWIEIQNWLLDLRRRGIAVLLIHHSAKNGGQRGTSRREDILDTVVKLRHPDDYKPSDGARFEVHLTKARHTHGDAAKSFEAKLTVIDGKAQWSVEDIGSEILDQACLLFENGYSVRKVAEKLKISSSVAGRLRRRLIEEGALEVNDSPVIDPDK